MIRFLLTVCICLVCLVPLAYAKDAAYNRVVANNTLRCGYGTWEPGVYKDVKTGEMKGLFVELIEEMARMAKIKVEWTSEVDWGQISEALRSGKVDAFCAGMAGDAARAKQLGYTDALSYWSFDVIVRADDARFPKNRPVTLEDLNKAEFSTAYTEGDVLETIKETELPNVKGVPLPPLGSPADNINNVLTKKTYFIVFPRVMIQNFEKANGTGKLRLLEMKTPLRVYPNVIAVDIQDGALLRLLNASIAELTGSGAYAKIMAKYNADYPGAFMSPAKPYLEGTIE